VTVVGGGCDLVFSLDDRPGTPLDGPSEADTTACTPQSPYDEDNDGLMNDCDPCPADTDNTDTDGDGVGDQCGDARPMLACEHRAFFDGFDDQDSRLVVTTGITVSSGRLLQPDSNADTAIATYPILTFNDTRVRAAFEDIAFLGGGVFGKLQIASGTAYNAGTQTLSGGYACALVDNTTGNLNVRLAHITANQQVDLVPFTGVPSGELVFTLDNAASGTIGCEIVGMQGAGTSMPSEPSTAESMGSIAVFANKVSANLRWIEVIERICD